MLIFKNHENELRSLAIICIAQQIKTQKLIAGEEINDKTAIDLATDLIEPSQRFILNHHSKLLPGECND